MRRQQQQAVLVRERFIDQLGALPLQALAQRLIRRAHPQPGQLGHHAAGLGDGSAGLRPGHAGNRRVLAEAAPVGRRRGIGDPADQRTQGVQKPQGPTGEEAEEGGHGSYNEGIAEL